LGGGGEGGRGSGEEGEGGSGFHRGGGDDAGVKREREEREEREENYLPLEKRVVFVEVHLPSKARIRGLNWDLDGDTDSDV